MSSDDDSSSYEDDQSSDDKKGNFADEDSSDDDDDNPNEFQSINVYPPGQYDEEDGVPSATNRGTNFDGSEEQTGNRKKMIAGLAVCCCIWLIASIVFGVLAFTKKDEIPEQTTLVTNPNPSSQPNPSPTEAPVAAPVTEPPSFNPSAQPSGFLQSEFVYPAVASTYIQQGLTVPQSNSATLLVENGKSSIF